MGMQATPTGLKASPAKPRLRNLRFAVQPRYGIETTQNHPGSPEKPLVPSTTHFAERLPSPQRPGHRPPANAGYLVSLLHAQRQQISRGAESWVIILQGRPARTM